MSELTSSEVQDAVDRASFPAIREPKLIKGLYVCKSGIALKSGRLVKDSVYHNHHVGYFYRYAIAKRVLSKTIRLDENATHTFIHNHWARGFHHWVVESLMRLASIREDLRDRIKLIIPDDFPAFAFESLKGMIDEQQLVRLPAGAGAHVPRALVIPNPDYQRFDSTSLLNLRERLMRANGISDNAGTPCRKVYISREFATMRRIENENEVQEWMRGHGYEIVHTEKLPFAKQIRLFAEAKEVVSIHGAALTNLMFMKPGTLVREFCHESQSGSDTRNHCFERMADAVDVAIDIVPFPVGENLGHHAGRANIVVDLERLNS